MRDLVLQGIMPANVLPFTENYDIDEVNLRRFVSYLLGVEGVRGIVCNGHAGELVSLSRAERKEVVRIVVDEVKARVPVIAIYFFALVLTGRAYLGYHLAAVLAVSYLRDDP